MSENNQSSVPATTSSSTQATAPLPVPVAAPLAGPSTSKTKTMMPLYAKECVIDEIISELKEDVLIFSHPKMDQVKAAGVKESLRIMLDLKKIVHFNAEYLKTDEELSKESRKRVLDIGSYDFKDISIDYICPDNYPCIDRHFEIFYGRETIYEVEEIDQNGQSKILLCEANDLLYEMEDVLVIIEEGINSGHLRKDDNLRKMLYVKIALALHNLINKMFPLNQFHQTYQTQEKERVTSMVFLGTLLLRMGYPYHALKKFDEFVDEFKAKLKTKEPIESNEFIVDNLDLIKDLFDDSKSETYHETGLEDLAFLYEQLSDLGKETPEAVAQIFDIAVYRRFYTSNLKVVMKRYRYYNPYLE